ncbi:MAG: 16S rRNA (guanine(966)-N(2))-methyltransferase RsmD [Eubacteriales bacterium]
MRVITGTARGRKLKEIEGMDIRPTTASVKESLFSIIQFELQGRDVLDLFGGTGQLSVEALSRGANSVTVVDARAESVGLIRENLAVCKFEANVVQRDAIAYLSSCKEKFDIILLDPPYETDLIAQAISLIERFDILKNYGIIVCESPVSLEIPSVSAPYFFAKEYKYGKIKLSTLTKKCEMSGENS